MASSNPIVFLDVKIGDERVGRLIIELFSNIVPKTAENFLGLCVGNHISSKTGKKLHYKGTIFHKAIPGVFIQGGDVINFDGTGGESIYGSPFEDENYELKHYRLGMLSAVNSGQNSNNSQFIITLGACPHLDGSNVVFGQVIKGLACAVEISEVKTEDDSPTVKCMIEDCGQLLLGDPWNYVDNDGTPDSYPPDPKDLEMKEFNIDLWREIICTIRESGNYFFTKGNYTEADRKYKKAVRYINHCSAQLNLRQETEDRRNQINKELEKEKISALLNSAAVALKKDLKSVSELNEEEVHMVDQLIENDEEGNNYKVGDNGVESHDDYEEEQIMLYANSDSKTKALTNIILGVEKGKRKRESSFSTWEGTKTPQRLRGSFDGTKESVVSCSE